MTSDVTDGKGGVCTGESDKTAETQFLLCNAITSDARRVLLILLVLVVVVVVVVASVCSVSHIRYLPQWLLHSTLLHA